MLAIRDTLRLILRPLASPAALALAMMAAGALLLGPTLGLFFFGLTLCASLTPSLAPCPETGSLPRYLGIAAAVAAVWFVAALLEPQITLIDWLAACLLLLSFLFFQQSLFRLVRQIIPQVAGATATALFLLWLTCPLWLFHHLQTPALEPWMHRIIAIHPFFAINSVIRPPIWTESPLSYRLLNLNQDVFYALPASPWNCIAAHALAAALLALPTVLKPTAPPASDNTP